MRETGVQTANKAKNSLPQATRPFYNTCRCVHQYDNCHAKVH